MHCLRHSRRMVTKTRQKVHWLHDLSLLRQCQYLSSSLDVCHCELRFVYAEGKRGCDDRLLLKYIQRTARIMRLKCFRYYYH